GNPTSTAGGLSIGSYTLTVTDGNGCSGIATAVVDSATVCDSIIMALGISIVNESLLGANDGQAAVSVSGGNAPYSYLWSNGNPTSTAGGLTSGIYGVTVTDGNGCSEISSATIGVAGPCDTTFIVVSVDITNESTAGANDGQAIATADGGQPSYTYLWSNGNPTSAAAGLTSGNYFVTVTDLNNCEAITSLTIGIGIGLSEVENNLLINVYPNPFNNTTTVQFSNINNALFELILYDISGKKVRNYTTSSDQFVIEGGQLSSGVYQAVISNQFIVQTVRIVKH
ncbi:MAG: T9SS type A sorting domain-containing protein, partial [Flavobacteriales bacterium]|nr:T9SS type A sorting domain-containing protein [Flavobacteriales bacterium]